MVVFGRKPKLDGSGLYLATAQSMDSQSYNHCDLYRRICILIKAKLNDKNPSPCINTLAGRGTMINQHYKKRYHKFIESINNKGTRNFSGYSETHHIIPRCLKGKDTKDNLIKLTLREHFLAHWLLWKAYPDYLPLASAFLQMNNKNPKTTKEFQGRITSRTYENLKINVYDLLKTHTTGWVYVKDSTGETIKLSKDEYLAQDSLKFHTSGKVYVFDVVKNEWVYINSQDYQLNKDRYKTRLSSEFRTETPVKFLYIDTETNQHIRISKLDATEINKSYGYKRLKQVQKKNIVCQDELGNFFTIPLEKYDPEIHTSWAKNTVNVFDTVEQVQKIIPLSDYNANPIRYMTSTKGKVLAKNSTGKTVLVSKDEFQNGNYVGITKGLRMVMDKETNQYIQITESEFIQNRSKYVGPCQGRVNVINKITGERKQIPKSEFNHLIYASLGNKKLLFLCRNKLTNKEKYINIYEWDLVKDHYEIIEYDRYKQALSLK